MNVGFRRGRAYPRILPGDAARSARSGVAKAYQRELRAGAFVGADAAVPDENAERHQGGGDRHGHADAPQRIAAAQDIARREVRREREGDDVGNHGAIERYVSAVNLYAALSDPSGAIDCRRALCDCYRDAAYRFIHDGKPQNAQAYYRAAVNILEVLVREQNRLDDRRTLASCHELLGEAYKLSRCRSEAKASYKEAIALRRRIFNETKESSDKDSLAAAEKAARRV